MDLDKVAARFKVARSSLRRKSGNHDLLLGLDHIMFHSGDTMVDGDLALRQTPLGPMVFGSSSESSETCVIAHVDLKESIKLDDFIAAEQMGIAVNPCCVQQKRGKVMTETERFEDDLIRKSAIKIGEQWMIPIPWSRSPSELPNNYSQAFARLKATEKKLRENPEFAEMYNQQVVDLVERGCARKLTKEELESYDGPVFYLSHHAVIRPEKLSTPCRLVFNSAASFRGHVLNNYQYKGPDLLQNLGGVLLRFRENAVAVVGDVRKMYHQVLILPSTDANCHRFLWRNMEDRPPDIYKKRVLTFGDKCSPAPANTAMNLTAEEHQAQFPQAADTILYNRYMDDVCDSYDSVEIAAQTIAEVDQILASGHFAIKEWVSNRDLAGTSTSKPGTKLRILANTDEKVLGTYFMGS